jgi:hypothetical protein
MREDNSDTHPQGLSPANRKEWRRLCRELLKLYDSMPIGSLKRKAVIGCEAGTDSVTNWLMFFRGTEEDAKRVRAHLGEIE